MNLQKAWEKLEHERLEKPAPSMTWKNPSRCRSKHPVQKLLNGLLTTLVFSVVFLVTFIVLIFLFEPWLIKFFIATIIGSYVFFTVYNFRTYQVVKHQLTMTFDSSLKTVLQNIHDIIHQSIRFQEKAALFIYPFSVIAGYMMGLSQHNNFENDIQDTRILVLLLIAIVILTPACFYLARWMYKITYDKYLAQLQNMIQDMNRPD